MFNWPPSPSHHINQVRLHILASSFPSPIVAIQHDLTNFVSHRLATHSVVIVLSGLTTALHVHLSNDSTRSLIDWFLLFNGADQNLICHIWRLVSYAHLAVLLGHCWRSGGCQFAIVKTGFRLLCHLTPRLFQLYAVKFVVKSARTIGLLVPAVSAIFIILRCLCLSGMHQYPFATS